MEVLATLLGVIVYIALFALGIAILCFQFSFLTQVPRLLKRIADALEQLADK